MRTCTKCNKSKPATVEFFRWRNNRTGVFRSWCRECIQADARAYREKHQADPGQAAKRRTYAQRPDVRERRNRLQRLRRQKPERKAVDAAQKQKPQYKAWQRKHDQARYASEEGRAYYKAYFQKRKGDPAFRARIRAYDNARKRTNPEFALRVTISAALHAMFRNYLKTRKNGKSWTTLFDFSCKELKSHLETRFQDSMTWRNRGRKHKQPWEIDHIVPVAWWDIASVDDPNFKLCWSLANLQPMWATDNRRKVAYRAVINGTTYTKAEWVAAGRPMPDSRTAFQSRTSL